MQSTFNAILLKNGLTEERALQCAEVFTANSVDGVYTHGVNRFPRFIEYIQKGYVKINAVPSMQSKFNGIEQWDGQLGPGITNALFAADHVTKLAHDYGIGCIGLSNTNHWMRGGTYGWRAAKAGYIFIGWSNTIANMPAWGATDAKLGNNPLVLALPYHDEAIVLDMAMSQYSFGAMEMAALKKNTLPVPGGYDKSGNLSTDPSAIIESRRTLPVGYWKGAGLALLLDILAVVLSGGLSTYDISSKDVEYALSQVFVAIDISKLHNYPSISKAIDSIIEDYRNSIPENESASISYPGERVLQTRARNLDKGVPVLNQVWENVMGLR